jgi:hypothetical protein
MAKSTAHSSYEGHAKGVAPLDERYGKIGISAVAAAARYQETSTPKNPAYVPDPDAHESSEETD